MLSVNIDRTEPLALHEQVAAEIRRAIAEGEAGPGERLPLARDIAAVDHAAGEMASGSDHVRSSASDLSTLAETLRASIARLSLIHI